MKIDNFSGLVFLHTPTSWKGQITLIYFFPFLDYVEYWKSTISEKYSSAKWREMLDFMSLAFYVS